MQGLMMETPLLITSLIKHAAANHGDTEIVSRSVEGPIHRYTYADSYVRIQKLANALAGLGVGEEDRIATLAWNGYRHFELYYAVSGMGSVCHTINPRLPADQIAYIVNHAEDQYIFTDLTFVPLIEAVAAHIGRVKGVVVMTDAAHMPETKLANVLCYEDLIADASESFDWPALDESAAASMCYTSGTTGNPKGALYSHRSTVLHALGTAVPDVFNYSADTVSLPVVPMFHVNAWGIPYCAPMTGAKLVFPGPKYDGASIYELMDGERVTTAAGVPTVWMVLLDYLRTSGNKLKYLKRTSIGGAAVPLSMIKEFEETHGVTVHHAWGMTEMSPVGTSGHLKAWMEELPAEQRYALKVKQGRAIYGVEMKIVGADGKELPHDGTAFGELQVRGPWIARSYYRDEAGTAAAFTEDGWLRTGDVSTIDPQGFMQIVDRTKDLIKSGGEWISSIDLENIAVGCPGVAEAGAIALPHPKWGERPLLVVVPADGDKPTRDDVLGYLKGKVVDYWLPDDVVFVEELPHTATGKIFKSKLREAFKDYKLPTA